MTLLFREITTADVPSLFELRPQTRENALTVQQLERLGITPRSVAESLTQNTRGWLCENAGQTVGFAMAECADAELLVIAVLPAFEGQGVGGQLMTLAESWLRDEGCTRAWLTTDLDPAMRAYGFYRRRGWTDWKIESGMRWMALELDSTARPTTPPI